VHVLNSGRIIFSGTPAQLINSESVRSDTGFTLSEFSGLVRGLINAGISLPAGNITIDRVMEALSALHDGR
jgi:ABC-type multidrug transport system fused ATPase/permease subunit